MRTAVRRLAALLDEWLLHESDADTAPVAVGMLLVGGPLAILGACELVHSAYVLGVLHQPLDAVHISHGRGGLLSIATNRGELLSGIGFATVGLVACALVAAAYFGLLRRWAGPEAARLGAGTRFGSGRCAAFWRRCGAAAGQMMRSLARLASRAGRRAQTR